jgi:hypothetical protein
MEIQSVSSSALTISSTFRALSTPMMLGCGPEYWPLS